jgi:hypothetical protein
MAFITPYDTLSQAFRQVPTDSGRFHVLLT